MLTILGLRFALTEGGAKPRLEKEQNAVGRRAG